MIFKAWINDLQTIFLQFIGKIHCIGAMLSHANMQRMKVFQNAA